MGHIVHNPSGIAAPAGRYSHGIEVPPNARWLFASGQVGVDRNGKAGATIDKQCQMAWKNVVAVLKSAKMTTADIVRVNVFLTDARHVAAYRAARDEVIGPVPPASTLQIVAALADPLYMVEIEIVAAKV